jgi:hypothetical protein
VSLPANFRTAIQSRDFSVFRWIEIEGMPYGYGTAAQAAGWFSGRAAGDQLLGIVAALKELPNNLDAQLDVLDGIASSVAQVEVAIVDLDGQPTVWTGVGKTQVTLAADILATDTSLTYIGDGTVLTSPIYIGTETIAFSGNNTVTKTLSGLTRAKYRSKAQAFGAGFPIGSTPYTLAKRRVWYYQCAAARGTAFADADKATRFLGTLEGFRLASPDTASYVLTLHSLEQALNRDVFRELRTFRDTSLRGISDANGTTPGATLDDSFIPCKEAGDFALFEVFAARVDNEIIGLLGYGTSSTYVQLYARGLMGTKVVAHDPGFTAKEVVLVTSQDYSRSVTAEGNYSQFTDGAADSAHWLLGDHPCSILLHVLLSTGLGTNNGGGGAQNYDTLPESWGLAIDYTRVDIDGIEAVARELPDIRFRGVIDSTVNFMDFARSILEPIGCFGLTQVGDLWTIKQNRPPYPDETGRAVDSTSIIAGQIPTWDANILDVVRSVTFRYSRDIASNNQATQWRNIHIERFTAADAYTGGQGADLSYDLPLLYAPALRIAGCVPGTFVDPEQWLLRRADFFINRYSRPPPKLSAVVDYSFLDAEVGDIVSVTHPSMPNPATGTRGLSAQLGQVTSKSIDDASKTITIEILLTGFQVTRPRFIGPSLYIASVTNPTTFVAAANRYSTPPDTDLLLTDSNGATVQPFFNGMVVDIWGVSFNSVVAATISSVNTGTRVVQLTGAPVLPLAVGQYVTLPDYATSNTPNGHSLYAWFADDQRRLFAPGQESAHTFFP